MTEKCAFTWSVTAVVFLKVFFTHTTEGSIDLVWLDLDTVISLMGHQT